MLVLELGLFSDFNFLKMLELAQPLFPNARVPKFKMLKKIKSSKPSLRIPYEGFHHWIGLSQYYEFEKMVKIDNILQDVLRNFIDLYQLGVKTDQIWKITSYKKMLDARSKILGYTQKFFSLADNAQIFQFSKMLERKDTVLDSIPTCYIILKSWRCAWNRCEYFVTSTNIPTQQVPSS